MTVISGKVEERLSTVRDIPDALRDEEENARYEEEAVSPGGTRDQQASTAKIVKLALRKK